MQLVLVKFCNCAVTTFLFGSNFEVDYGSEEHATIVYKTLAVDKEVKHLFFYFLACLPASLNFFFHFVHGMLKKEWCVLYYSCSQIRSGGR